jgi:hypothetical protein
MNPEIRDTEASWSLVTKDPRTRMAVCVRATSDPETVLFEIKRSDDPTLHYWFLHRSEMRSLGEQLGFWAQEFGRTHQ